MIKKTKTNSYGLIDLKNQIKKMSEDVIKIEKPYNIVETVEKILELNQQKPKKPNKIKKERD